ncbi:MAG TPA: hypothetical protein VJU83_01085 [Burkholderiales bacterium]|nr:hypothetical protein [Burkholderiales bacterium]
MSVHVLKQDEELFDLEYLARTDVSEGRGQILSFPTQPPGMMSYDEKLYQRFDAEVESPAYENLAVDEDFTETKEVLER